MRKMAALLLVAACAEPRAAQDLSAVEGVWESPYTRMDIQADGQVVWYSAGWLDDSHGQRCATYSAGKLNLSEPVQEYVNEQRRVFYYFRHGGREFLVAQEDLHFLEEQEEPFGVWCGLRRRHSKAVLQERFAATKDEHDRRDVLDEWASWGIDRAGVDYLERVLRDDPSEYVRAGAVVQLKWSAGRREFGEVVDQPVHAAAESVLTRCKPGSKRLGAR